MDGTSWWQTLDAAAAADLEQVWIPIGLPGFQGDTKARRREVLDERFGADGWRIGHVVRGRIVPPAVAILEYEEAYRVFLRDRPALVRFLVSTCGNVYDDKPSNVFDADYEQPDTNLNHYQDISVRRVVAELVDDPGWPDVVPTPHGTRPSGAPRVGLPWIAPAPDPRPAVARLRAQPGGRPGPRPGADHHPPVARRVVSRRGLRSPLGGGVLADEQDRRGALRPLARAG
jgi:hypothetical protein